MSGFFVSNSFGHFNSESATKEFNAVQLRDIPSAPGTTTFQQLLQNNPTITGLGTASAWGINDDLHIKHGKDGGKSSGENLGGSSGSHQWPLSESQADKFFQWVDGSDSSPYMLLYPGDAFKWVGHDKSTAKFQVTYVTSSRPTPANAYSYVHNIKKNGTGDNVAWVSALSSNSCFSNYVRDDDAGTCGFDVEITGNDNWMSIDVGLVESGSGATGDIHASRFKTECGTWEHRNPDSGGIAEKRKSQSNEPQDEGVQRVQIKLLSITWNPVEGCTDPDANNTKINPPATPGHDDGSCTYTTTTINSFTATPTTTTFGSNQPVIIKWSLTNANFSKVSITHNGVEVNTKPSAQDSSISVLPTSVGNNTYQLKVTWDKPNAKDMFWHGGVTVNAVAPASYLPCDPLDIHRNTDNHGECAECKTGYSMIDATTGFCTNCEATNDDLYRDMNTDGTCGDCMAGYAEDTNGTCQKVGCMTYADGTSAEDDYNYDPDAVTNDSSMCQGQGDPDIVPEAIDCELSDWSDWSEWSDATTSSGTRTRTRTVVTGQSGGGAGCPDLEQIETGVLDPNTGTVTTTTTGGDDPAATTPASPSLAAPLIIGGIVLTIGLLVMRR